MSDLFQTDDASTPLTEEEKSDLIPSHDLCTSPSKSRQGRCFRLACLCTFLKLLTKKRDAPVEASLNQF